MLINKKFWLIFLFVSFFMIGAVSASDNDTDIVSSQDCEELTIGDNVEQVSKTISVSGSKFSAIQSKIDSANDGDIIQLNSAKYSATDSSSTILVKKSITIQAKTTTTLDAKSLSGIIHAEKHITLKNIKFINSASNDIALNALGGCSLINCTFENNPYKSLYAICDELSDVNVENCQFTGNKEGAIDVQNVNLNVVSSIFSDNFNPFSGGAIAIHSSSASIKDSTFTNNVANSSGGAIYIDSALNTVSINNCKFISNQANYGSSINDWVGVNLINNIFSSNKAILKDNIDGLGDLDVNAYLENNIITNNINSGDVAKLIINTLGNDYGDLLEVKVINPLNNLPFSNKQVSIYSYFEDMSSPNIKLGTTDGNGILKIMPVPYAGNHDLRVIADLGNFKVVSSMLNIVYNKVIAKISPVKLTTTYNSGKFFTIKVTGNSNKPIRNTALNVFLMGPNFSYKTYKIFTDNNGIAKLATSSLKVGKYSANIRFHDWDDSITAKDVDSTITISKAKTTVNAPKVTAKFKKSKTFKITVKDKSLKKPIKSIKVKVKIFTGKKSVTKTIKTNKNGIAQFNTKSLKKGSHKVVISSGNSNYQISAKTKIIIK